MPRAARIRCGANQGVHDMASATTSPLRWLSLAGLLAASALAVAAGNGKVHFRQFRHGALEGT